MGMQPQMPYGPPQPGSPQPQPQPIVPGQTQPQYPTSQYPQQPGGQPQPSQLAQPYFNQNNGQNPNQPPMPQYQPPVGYRPQSGALAPLPPPPPIAKTPYDFFMQQKHPVGTKLPVPGKRSANLNIPGGKLGMLGVGVAAVAVIAVLFAALSPKDTTSQELITLAQTQQEVARVCDQGRKAKYQITRNYAINCSTAVGSDQRKLVTYLGKHSVKLKGKQLGALANSRTDSQLTSATSTSTFDNTFKIVVEKQLTSYGSLLKQQLASPSLSSTARTLLESSLASDKLLLEQVQADSTDKTEAPAAS